MSIAVGLDIGNDRCVVAVSRDGVSDAILNEYSKRETPAAVHFARSHRIFGSEAISYVTSRPDSTVTQLKNLVLHPRSVAVEGLGNFTPAQVLAMLMSHIKKAAARTVGSSLSDCVIGVPAYFTDQQKRAYLDAARVAGWNPLVLLHEGAATALEYGNSRPDGAADGRAVAFVDIGHSDTQISVVRFDGGRRDVVSQTSDENLGGRDFDEVLFRYFAEKFRQEYAVDVSSNAKAKARLTVACEKAKKVLSSNREAGVSVETSSDEEAKGEISRQEFERRSSYLVDRIADLFEEALRSANCQVHSVEVVGSGSRIPAISRRLSEVFGAEVSWTINGSECIARGCALLCETLNRSDPNQINSVILEDLGISSSEYTIPDAAASYLSEFKTKEQELNIRDILHRRAKRVRNDLESCIYEERRKRSRGDKEDATLESLAQLEDWLYNEGDDESFQVYSDKLKKLKQLVSTDEKEETPPAKGILRELMVTRNKLFYSSIYICIFNTNRNADRPINSSLVGRKWNEMGNVRFLLDLVSRFLLNQVSLFQMISKPGRLLLPVIATANITKKERLGDCTDATHGYNAA